MSRLQPAKKPTHQPSHKNLSLDRIPDATEVVVLEVCVDHGAERQLARLGICAGATLRVRRAAPLGGPVLVDVQGSTVAIGRKLALLVRVRRA